MKPVNRCGLTWALFATDEGVHQNGAESIPLQLSRRSGLTDQVRRVVFNAFPQLITWSIIVPSAFSLC